MMVTKSAIIQLFICIIIYMLNVVIDSRYSLVWDVSQTFVIINSKKTG
jgi:hypothetical protein